jgi:hypothetical protein
MAPTFHGNTNANANANARGKGKGKGKANDKAKAKTKGRTERVPDILRPTASYVPSTTTLVTSALAATATVGLAIAASKVMTRASPTSTEQTKRFVRTVTNQASPTRAAASRAASTSTEQAKRFVRPVKNQAALTSAKQAVGVAQTLSTVPPANQAVGVAQTLLDPPPGQTLLALSPATRAAATTKGSWVPSNDVFRRSQKNAAGMMAMYDASPLPYLYSLVQGYHKAVSSA